MTRASISAAFSTPAFRSRLMRWYREHGRHDLPWRLTRDPYAVLVSEVMLQQTQVDRVLPYYERWLARWPHFAALAAASPAEVIREWRGLGYNRRALNLHRLASRVVVEHGGKLPVAPAELLALPGIGPYTAAAVRSFAREERVAVADTNIARVVARHAFGVASQKGAQPRELLGVAEAALPPRNTRDHNLALMDLGALVCTVRAPTCLACPVANGCAWRRAGCPPAAVRGPATPRFETTARFARGRIVDALREAPSTDRELRALLPRTHGERLEHYLAGLERDGLVVKAADGEWSLPH